MAKVRIESVSQAPPAAESFRPLGDRVLIRRAAPEAQSAGGILLPDTAREKPCRGTVVAVGPGQFSDGVTKVPEVTEGDVVLFPAYGGTPVTVAGEELLILAERDLLGVIESEE